MCVNVVCVSFILLILCVYWLVFLCLIILATLGTHLQLSHLVMVCNICIHMLLDLVDKYFHEIFFRVSYGIRLGLISFLKFNVVIYSYTFLPNR